MTLEKLFHFGAECADHLFTKQGHLVPMWIGINEKNSHIPLLVPNLADKDKSAEMVRHFLKKEKIIRFVSLLECWSYFGKTPPPELAKGESLENNPDRRECIHIYAEDKDNNTISGRFFILRPEHSKPKLSPLKIDREMGTAEGRFVGMFH